MIKQQDDIVLRMLGVCLRTGGRGVATWPNELTPQLVFVTRTVPQFSNLQTDGD